MALVHNLRRTRKTVTSDHIFCETSTPVLSICMFSKALIGSSRLFHNRNNIKTFQSPLSLMSDDSTRSYNQNSVLGIDWLRRKFQNLKFWFGSDPCLPPDQRKKVIVLGTGWAAMNFLTRLDIAQYDVSIISPRNYFAFTPLLPSVCAGTLSPRSCLEPVRNKVIRGGKKVMDFYEAWATSLDPMKNSLVCKSKTGEEFRLHYDYLVISVGAETNTFNIPGVAENANFLKEVENARTIHKKILDNLERASLPNISEEMKRKLLHFVIVGGGPTGVETAAELSDFIREDAIKYFPHAVPHVNITLIEMLPKVLPTFSNRVSEFSISNLKKAGVSVKLQCRVTKLTREAITIVDEYDQEQEMYCSFVLWASGLGQVPFSRAVLETIEEQKNNRAIHVNERLQVIGGGGNLYAMGDCAHLTPEPLSNHIESLFEAALHFPDGPGPAWLKKEAKYLTGRFPQLHPLPACLDVAVPQKHMIKEEFIQLIKEVDESFKAPPPTAQNANQEGQYLASIFNQHFTNSSKAKAPAYIYRWKGSMAYVGRNQYVIESSWGSLLGGIYTCLFWRTFYWTMQMSITNKAICLFDWCKSIVRGRDVGRDHSEGVIPKIPSSTAITKSADYLKAQPVVDSVNKIAVKLSMSP